MHIKILISISILSLAACQSIQPAAISYAHYDAPRGGRISSNPPTWPGPYWDKKRRNYEIDETRLMSKFCAPQTFKITEEGDGFTGNVSGGSFSSGPFTSGSSHAETAHYKSFKCVDEAAQAKQD